ncbi:putative receptor protein kinase ZmPK1 [Gossypium hirsutum]|uniref:Receptor protein kinase ZmPK1 n=1 Tax=Gossypium hirsutum TaxID=3635 RepID=A0ABM3BLG6_GOSHI|nr:putative receptor protein kinase ZmPK1 [Gossypium hirsutum]
MAGWERFNYPTDTILSSQTYRSNENAFIKLEANGVVTQENGATLVSSDFDEQNKSRRLTLDDNGNIRIHIFDLKNRESTIVWLAVQEMCTVHGTYGDNAICMDDVSNTDPSSCVCPPGFKNNTIVNESNFCVIKTPLNNNHGNTKFLQLDYVNFSRVSDQSFFQSKCLANPNCLGFGFKYDGKGYCVLQINQLRYGYRSPGTETAFFLRVHESETDEFNFTGMTTLLETTCAVNITLQYHRKNPALRFEI